MTVDLRDMRQACSSIDRAPSKLYLKTGQLGFPNCPEILTLSYYDNLYAVQPMFRKI